MREKYVKRYFALSHLLVNDFLLFNVLFWSSIKKFKLPRSQNLESWVLGSEFWVLSPRSYVPEPEFCVLGHRSRVSSPGSQVLGHKSHVLGSESWVLGPRSLVLGVESWVQGPQSWILGRRSQVLVPWSWVPRPGSWVLGPGSWLLDPGICVLSLGLGSRVPGPYFRLCPVDIYTSMCKKSLGTTPGFVFCASPLFKLEGSLLLF